MHVSQGSNFVLEASREKKRNFATKHEILPQKHEVLPQNTKFCHKKHENLPQNKNEETLWQLTIR
jgi:hypothetical protein